jgi:gluconolactonase
MMACSDSGNKTQTSSEQTPGSIERFDAALDAIISKDAKIEIIAEGFDWSEGPLWVEQHDMLLFSDIPKNTIHKWTEANGAEVYLTPSGYTGSVQRGGETGSNALILNKDGKLVLCQHGNRQMAWMDAPLNSPKPQFKTIAGSYEGKKFNSPNDAVFRSNGDLFFTDPPYGLEGNMEDPLKEIPFQGVYKVAPGGKVTLLTDSISRPNGIAFTTDEKTLIVANSDPKKPCWYVVGFDENDALANGRVFYDASAEAKTENGLPEGSKIDRNGTIFATCRTEEHTSERQ